MFVFSLDGSRNQAGLRRHSSSASNTWSSSWIVATNLSGSCSTMANSQSSLQRVLVSPGKVSPPKGSRHLGSQFSTHAASRRHFRPLTTGMNVLHRSNYLAKSVPEGKPPATGTWLMPIWFDVEDHGVKFTGEAGECAWGALAQAS